MPSREGPGISCRLVYHIYDLRVVVMLVQYGTTKRELVSGKRGEDVSLIPFYCRITIGKSSE